MVKRIGTAVTMSRIGIIQNNKQKMKVNKE